MEHAVFTKTYREDLLASLIRRAEADPCVSAAAMTGSGAAGATDAWSDIDFMIRVRESALLGQVMADWTAFVTREFGAVHHLDVPRGPTVYRVFFLANTLQVDIAFAAPGDFGARASTFQLLFGEVDPDVQPWEEPSSDTLIGYCWLYALHVRSCLMRGQWWRAEYMVSGLRDSVLVLAARRFSLPISQARGVDRLPEAVRRPFAETLPKALTREELTRVFLLLTGLLLEEVQQVDPALAGRLSDPLWTLVPDTTVGS